MVLEPIITFDPHRLKEWNHRAFIDFKLRGTRVFRGNRDIRGRTDTSVAGGKDQQRQDAQYFNQFDQRFLFRW